MLRPAIAEQPDPHFSIQYCPEFTLEPLRSDGPDALDTQGFETIRQVTLHECEIWYPNALHEIIIHRSDDLFSPAGKHAWHEVISSGGTLVGAAFDIHFKGHDRPVRLRIRPPYTLQLDPPCYPADLFGWLGKIGIMAKSLALLALVSFSALLSPVDVDDDDGGHHPWTFSAGSWAPRCA